MLHFDLYKIQYGRHIYLGALKVQIHQVDLSDLEVPSPQLHLMIQVDHQGLYYQVDLQNLGVHFVLEILVGQMVLEGLIVQVIQGHHLVLKDLVVLVYQQDLVIPVLHAELHQFQLALGDLCLP